MAYEFLEGWDPYTAAIASPWDSIGGVNQSGLVGGGLQRTGRVSLEVRNGGVSETLISRSVPSVNLFNCLIGFGFATSNAGIAGDLNSARMGFVIDNGFSNFVKMFTGNGGNNLRWRRNGTSFGTQSPGNTLTTNNYVYVIIHFIINGGGAGTDTLEWWINGANIAGGPMNVPGGSSLNQVQRIICGSSGNASEEFYRYDDMFVINNPTNAEITALTAAGSPAVFTQALDANGVDQEWTTVGPGSAFENINEEPLDAADYIQAALAGEKSNFGIANNGQTLSEVFAVSHKYAADKQTAGNGSVQATLISNGTNGAGGDNALPQNDTDNYEEDIYATDPDTGAAWAVPALNNLNVQFDRTL